MTDIRWAQSEDASGGKPVLLLSNPLGAALEVWDPILVGLTGSFRVLRYDSPGHGKSPIRDDMELASLAAVAVEVLDAAGVERAHMAGLSLGAMVAIVSAASHPSRIQTISILCSSAHFEDKQLWSARADEARTAGLEGLADASLARWFTPEWTRSHPAAIAAARRLFLETTPEGYARTVEAVGRMDLRPTLATVTCPALVIAGRSDPSTPPAMLREIADGVRDATYRELDGAHWLPVERPVAVTAVLTQFVHAHEPA